MIDLPDDDACAYCSGEACALCPDLPRVHGPDCEHDVSDRHGEEECPYIELDRIADELRYIEREALGIYTVAGVEVWLDAPNKMLEGKSPRQMVEEKRTGEVIDLINALAEGVFM